MMALHTATSLFMNRLIPTVAGAMVGSALLLQAGPVFADTRITGDYVAIDVEAEDLDSGDDRWVLTNPTTGQIDDDPDPNHSNGAVGQTYLELLPDVRVTHADPAGPPTAYWGNPGGGPDLNYTVDFPEGGRYYVHVRALSTGTEDNGIHVGLNGDFPSHGARMQWCTANLGWKWSSAQRGDEEHPCGVEKTIWLDVPSGGEHTVTFTAREDGFEIDRFMLIKDLSGNTRRCSPTGDNDVFCVDGGIAQEDDVVDLAVTLDTDRNAGVEGDVFVFTATVVNQDDADTAENVSLTFDLDLGSDWAVESLPTACQSTGSTVECNVGSLAPGATGDNSEFGISVEAINDGTHTVTASVASSDTDGVTVNDSTSQSVSVEQGIQYTTLSSGLNVPTTPVQELAEFSVSVEVDNTGANAAESPSVSVEFPEEIYVTSAPNSCVGNEPYVCQLADISSNQDVTVAFLVEAQQAGLYPIQVTVAYDNSESEAEQMTEFVSIIPIPEEAPIVEPVVEPADEVMDELLDIADENDEASDLADAGDMAIDSATESLARGGSLGHIGLLGLLGVAFLRRRTLTAQR